MAVREVRVLSFHAPYRCQNSGACCTASWPIPVEADRLARLQAELATGALKATSGTKALLIAPGAPADTPALLAVHDGRCVFHNPAGSCEIHNALGHGALPLACRQFPRVSVRDPRGVSITLSHYCPTVAGLLRDESDREGAAIQVNASNFPAHEEYVGMDAVHALPPLLRRGMLMDWEAWWEIERLSVDLLLGRGHDADEALAMLRGAVSDISVWSPGPLSLLDRIHDAFENPTPRPGTDRAELIAEAKRPVPAELRHQFPWKAAVASDDLTTRRFLAAHAFASWAIHVGNGLESWLRAVETAHAFLEAGAGVRHADLILRHLSDHEPEYPST